MMGLQSFARGMRSVPTDAEAVLWRQLRAHRFAGHKFKRQQPTGNYILDFVCFEAKLVVEVDGGQHMESASDKLRDEWVKSQGFAVLRFWNNEVFQNLEGVLMRILEALPPSPPPLQGALPAASGSRSAGAAQAPRISCSTLSHEGRGAKRSSRRLSQTANDLKGKTATSEQSPSLSPRGRRTEGEGE